MNVIFEFVFYKWRWMGQWSMHWDLEYQLTLDSTLPPPESPWFWLPGRKLPTPFPPVPWAPSQFMLPLFPILRFLLPSAWGNDWIALVGGLGRILFCHCPLSQWMCGHGHRELPICIGEEDKAVAVLFLVAVPWMGYLVGDLVRSPGTLNPGTKCISVCKNHIRLT